MLSLRTSSSLLASTAADCNHNHSATTKGQQHSNQELDLFVRRQYVLLFYGFGSSFLTHVEQRQSVIFAPPMPQRML